MTFSRIHARPFLTLACCIAMVGGIAGSRAQADEWNKKTVLTVNQPIQVTSKVLDPGQYVFILDNSSSDRHIVRIFNADQSRLIETVMAVPNYRVQRTGNSRFIFWETPPGTAPALKAWFSPGDNFGQEFPYPKHPQVLQATATTANTVAANQQPPAYTAPNDNNEATREVAPAGSKPAASQTAPAQEDQAAIAPQNQTATAQQNENAAAQQTAGEADRSQPEEQAQIAQNNPPAAPAQQQAQQSQQSTERQRKPAELPKTASPYGLIGLLGIGLLGIAGLLHLKRTA